MSERVWRKNMKFREVLTDTERRKGEGKEGGREREKER